MITKEQMEQIQEKHKEAKKDFKNRCFFVIEALVSGDIEYSDIEKLKSDIYEIAHVGCGTCNNEHKEWVENTERLFNAFEEGGLI